MASVSQEQVMEEQKKKCPFCHIIAGNIPANKVYEDDKVLAILDINPAAKGHVLLIPKEHFPLLAMCPPELFRHLFVKVRDLSKSIEEGLLSQGTQIFIAGGAAAGQQSYHFMIHIIPREEGDGIDVLDLPHKVFPKEKLGELKAAISKNLNIMLGRRFGKIKSEKITKEQIFEIIDKNSQLKNIILNSPDDFKNAVPANPQLKSIFSGFDLDELISEVNEKYGKTVNKKNEKADGNNKSAEKSKERKSKESRKNANNKKNNNKKGSDSDGSNIDLDAISEIL